MRTFTLHRSVDETGVSGTGTVLEGVEFSDGSVVLCWTSEPRSHVLWGSFEDFYKVHVASHPQNGSIVTFSDGEELVQPPAEEAMVDNPRTNGLSINPDAIELPPLWRLK